MPYVTKNGSIVYVDTLEEGDVEVDVDEEGNPINLENENNTERADELTAEKIVATNEGEKFVGNKVVPPENKVTRYKYYTLHEGTPLYHASRFVSKFERTNINFGQNGNNNSAIWFATNFSTAENQIAKCQPMYLQDGNVLDQGWIHEFRVEIPIPNIKLVSNDDKDFTFNLKNITENYCGAFDPTNPTVHLNGIGFFKDYPDGSTDSQFALCTPTGYLAYIGTHTCVNGNLMPIADTFGRQQTEIVNNEHA